MSSVKQAVNCLDCLLLSAIPRHEHNAGHVIRTTRGISCNSRYAVAHIDFRYLSSSSPGITCTSARFFRFCSVLFRTACQKHAIFYYFYMYLLYSLWVALSPSLSVCLLAAINQMSHKYAYRITEQSINKCQFN